METQTTYAIGVMSGTSLDGLDIAYCKFDELQNKLSYKVINAKTIKYLDIERQKLSNAHLLNATDFIKLHAEYGTYIGEQVLSFIKQYNCKPSFIASHGHTIFHNPQEKITFQLGSGAHIYAVAGIPVINDFRNTDVALGGQGAPLVPLGDKLLFNEYEAALNLGGFSNITLLKNEIFIASDICPINILLNKYANKYGFAFDKEGAIGRVGKINIELLNKFAEIEAFSKFPRHSLSREWIEMQYIPLIDSAKCTIPNIMRTLYEHICIEIAKILEMYHISNVIVTGGGAYNNFLIELLKEKTSTKIIIPENSIIEYKEALIFALLGSLRLQNKINVMSEITGAAKNTSSGAIWG